MLSLQSTHMASNEVSEVTVYACTGNPLPEDVEHICQWLFNTPFVDAFNSASPLRLSHHLVSTMFHCGRVPVCTASCKRCYSGCRA